MKHLVFFVFLLVCRYTNLLLLCTIPRSRFICYLSRMQRIFFLFICFFCKKTSPLPNRKQSFSSLPFGCLFDTKKVHRLSLFFGKKKKSPPRENKKEESFEKNANLLPQAFKFPRSE